MNPRFSHHRDEAARLRRSRRLDHPRPARDLGEGQREVGVREERMLRARNHHLWFIEDRHDLVSVIVTILQQSSQHPFDLAPLELRDHLVTRRDINGNFDLRVTRLEPGDRRGHEGGHGAGDRTDPKRSIEPCVERRQSAPRGPEFAQRLLGKASHHVSCWRRDHPARRALEEPGPQPGLKLLQQAGGGGLTDRELGGRAPQVAVSGQGGHQQDLSRPQSQQRGRVFARAAWSPVRMGLGMGCLHTKIVIDRSELCIGNVRRCWVD